MEIDGHRFCNLGVEADAERFVADVLRWLPDAAGGYFQFVCGDSGTAMAVLTRWLTRDSSELSVKRVSLLCADQSLGGFLALSGAELAACLRADSLALIKETDRWNRVELAMRLRAAAGVRPSVDYDVFYLSKLGVVPEARGRGFGRLLALEFLRTGRSRGFRRFQLDVDCESRPAISLYESIGMSTVSESRSADGSLQYKRMSMDDELSP